VHIGEVKRTQRVGPGSPQLERMSDATRLIQESRIERENEQPLNIHRIDVPYKTRLDVLNEVVSNANEQGYSAAKAGPCLFVEVLRYDRGLSDEEVNSRRAVERDALGWFDGNTMAFEWIWSVRRMRDRRTSFATLAPVTLLPLAAEDVADIAMGFVEVIVTLNTDCLAGGFRAKGLGIDIARPPESGEIFLRATKRFADRELTVQVSPHLREQMLNELMTPGNVIAAVEALIEILAEKQRAPGRHEEQHIVALADEGRVWKQS
jgi:hypothetical protein